MPEHNKTKIHIDNKLYEVEKDSMTGAELRTLPQPPIGSERDLYLEIPGSDNDNKITNDEVVQLKNGMHFYTVPATINPGSVL